ncbi:hypothetical protein [Holdemania massiliensis]|uniref:hypothetical protein n=1 Tax=Holdemania massiliensis TaxID=1468449 RepID=UPI001F05E939|nr:hypothetical protein [Holdemania massiliensis]MCH1942417.1 hypothetical protein [Holdemania massiliensis]
MENEENKQASLPRDDKTFFTLNDKGYYAIAKYENHPDQEFLGVDEEFMRKMKQLNELLDQKEEELEDGELEM